MHAWQRGRILQVSARDLELRGKTIRSGSVHVEFDDYAGSTWQKWVSPESVVEKLRRPASDSIGPCKLKVADYMGMQASDEQLLPGGVEDTACRGQTEPKKASREAEAEPSPGEYMQDDLDEVASWSDIPTEGHEDPLRRFLPSGGSHCEGDAVEVWSMPVQIRRYQRGEAVEMWCDATRIWRRGIITEVAASDMKCRGALVQAGSLNVHTETCSTWVPPSQTGYTLRPLPLRPLVASVLVGSEMRPRGHVREPSVSPSDSDGEMVISLVGSSEDSSRCHSPDDARGRDVEPRRRPRASTSPSMRARDRCSPVGARSMTSAHGVLSPAVRDSICAGLAAGNRFRFDEWREALTETSPEMLGVARDAIVRSISDLDAENVELQHLLALEGTPFQRQCPDAQERVRCVAPWMHDFPEVWFAAMSQIVHDLRVENIGFHVAELKQKPQALGRAMATDVACAAKSSMEELIQNLRDENAELQRRLTGEEGWRGMEDHQPGSRKSVRGGLKDLRGGLGKMRADGRGAPEGSGVAELERLRDQVAWQQHEDTMADQIREVVSELRRENLQMEAVLSRS